MSRESIIVITLISYKLVLIGIGLWAQRRTTDTTDYFLGGRQLGAMVAAISYAAGSSSAWTLLGVSGAAFSLGVGVLWLLPGIIGCHIIAWFWIAPRLRRLSVDEQHLTLTDVLAHDSGSARGRITVAASLITLFCFMFYVAAQFQGAGATFTSNFNISSTEAITLGAAIVLIYTLLGGFWAVSLTDTLQGLLMLLAAILLPIAALLAVGGIGPLIDGLHAVSTPSQLSWSAGNAGLMAVGFAAGMMLVGLGTFGQPHLLNRFMALKDEASMRTARFISVGWFVIVLIGMITLGLCGHVLSPATANGETLFFELTNSLFPVFIGAVITAAVLSAVMSTADSQLLVAASCVAHDLGLAKRSPQHALLISRLVMASVCIVAVIIATGLPASIFSRVLFAWNGLGAAFGPIVFARIMGWKIAPNAILPAMLTGFGLTALLYSLPNTPGDIAERLIPFAASMVIVWLARRPGFRQALQANS